MPDAVRALADAGFGDRLLLGGDTVVAGARSVDGGPGMPYLLRRVGPRLAVEVGASWWGASSRRTRRGRLP